MSTKTTVLSQPTFVLDFCLTIGCNSTLLNTIHSSEKVKIYNDSFEWKKGYMEPSTSSYLQ